MDDAGLRLISGVGKEVANLVTRANVDAWVRVAESLGGRCVEVSGIEGHEIVVVDPADEIGLRNGGLGEGEWPQRD